MPLQVTTDFPAFSAADIPRLDASTEDQLAVSPPSTLNYGRYRVQYRVSGTTSWTTAGTIASDGSPLVITGLADGEQYDVRLRQETEHKLDAYAAPLTAVTVLPAPGVTATAPSPTVVDVAIADNADNEDDYVIERTRLPAGDGSSAWPPDQLAVLAPNPTTYEDDTAPPATTLRYTATVRTEHVAASTTDTVTTPALADVQLDRAPTSGVYVEVEASDGTVRRPTVLDSLTERPSLNDYPRVEIPVRRDESWLADRWDEAELRVYRDGERLPIDGLADQELQPDRTVLYGRGGAQLDTYVEEDLSFTTVHTAMQQLLGDTTDYRITVDDPGGVTDEQVQALDTTLDFAEALTADAETPVYTTDADGTGEVRLSRTTYGIEGEAAGGSYTTRSSAFYGDTPDFSGSDPGFAAEVVSGPAQFTFAPTHDIPAEHVGVRIRRHVQDATGEPVVDIDSQDIDERVIGGEQLGFGGAVSEPLEWIQPLGARLFNVGPSGTSDEAPAPPRLEAGTTYTLDVEVSSATFNGTTYTPSGAVDIDYIAVYDQRFEPSFPSSTDSNSSLPGPEPYPESVVAEFEPEASLRGAIAAALLESTWRDGRVGRVALSNDGGETWSPWQATTALDYDFEDLGPSVQFRVELSRYDTGSAATPTTGDGTQGLQSATLSVDTSGSPTVSAKTVRGPLRDVLRRLADRGDVLFEVQVQDGELEVVVTYPGQRSSGADLADRVDYRVRKQPTERVDILAVFGRRATVNSEEFTAQTSVDLSQQSIIEGSERVVDPSANTTFERGEDKDYTMAYGIGELQVVSGSDITDGQEYEISYDWQPSFTTGQTPLERKRQVHIPELVSIAECRDASYWLLQELATEPWEATVEIPRREIGFSLADELDPARLPGTGSYRVRQLEISPESVTLELGRGTTVSEAVDELRSRLTTVERSV